MSVIKIKKQVIHKQKEKMGNQGFLKWLERRICAEIDTLSNKTFIKEYHEHDSSKSSKRSRNKNVYRPIRPKETGNVLKTIRSKHVIKVNCIVIYNKD